MQYLSQLYDSKRLRGKAKDGYVRPTLREIFTADVFYEEIEKDTDPIDLSQYNNVVYVDETGNDSTGDGSDSNPYATIQTGIDSSVDGDAIYIIGYHQFQPVGWNNNPAGGHIYLPSHNLDFIGDGLTSEVKNTGDYDVDGDGTVVRNLLKSMSSDFSGTYNFYKLNFTSMDWNNSTNLHYQTFYHGNSSNINLYFYNCNINMYEITGSTLNDMKYENCNLKIVRDVVGDSTPSEALNVAGNSDFSSQFDTVTTCLWNASYDNNWNITSSGWQNTGTGTNPDGTQAHIGVYGGDYAWE